MTSSGKEDYKRLKELGLCVQCKKAKAAPAKSRCWDCLADGARRNRVAREAAGKNGLCRYCCKHPAAEGEKACSKCLKKKRSSGKTTREVRRKQFLCTTCGGEIEFARSGYHTCESCARPKIRS